MVARLLPRRVPGHERAQAVPLAVVSLVAVATLGVVTARAGAALARHAQARTAADAAALAGAVAGREAASQMATENGGVLVEFVRGPGWVEVRVRVGDAVASARAGASTALPAARGPSG